MGDVGSQALGRSHGGAGAADQHPSSPGRARRPLRHGGHLGDPPGRLVPVVRQADLPDGAHPPPLRAARTGRRPRSSSGSGSSPASRSLSASASSTGTSSPWRAACREDTRYRGRHQRPGSRRLARTIGDEVTVFDAIRPRWPIWPARSDGLRGLVERSARSCRSLVVSPGVPEHAAEIRDALAAGIPVISEIELAASVARAPLVAVTGTNGKTTVTGADRRRCCWPPAEGRWRRATSEPRCRGGPAAVGGRGRRSVQLPTAVRRHFRPPGRGAAQHCRGPPRLAWDTRTRMQPPRRTSSGTRTPKTCSSTTSTIPAPLGGGGGSPPVGAGLGHSIAYRRGGAGRG